MNTNPFVFGKVVSGFHFVNRKKERAELATEIENHTNIILYAPRRYGKTSLVHKTFADLKRKHKSFVGLIIDFYRINSKEKFMISLTNEYARNSGFSFERLLSYLRQTIRGISPSLEMDPFGNPQISIQLIPGTTDKVFEDVMKLPQKLADDGKLVSVFFDEFQEIAALNGNNFQKELRAEIQHHKDVSYIFSGSKYHLFKELFESKENPLYHIGKSLNLGLIEKSHYTRYILKHFRIVNAKFNKQAAEKIFYNANGIPYYIQMLAHEIYNLALLNDDGAPDEIIELAQQNILTNKGEEFLLLYENLNLSQKITLEIIIQNGGKGLFKKDVIAHTSIAASSLKKALDTLIKKGVLTKTGTVYIFQDAFFERWLRSRQ